MRLRALCLARQHQDTIPKPQTEIHFFFSTYLKLPMVDLLSVFPSEQMSKLDQKDPAESPRLPFQLLLHSCAATARREGEEAQPRVAVVAVARA